MRYILYARKSSESEERQVQSIDDQLRVVRDFAKRSGLDVVAELTEAHSAKAPGTRPVFAELLARIERGEAEGIVCWSINRLARNPVDSGQLSWLLQRGVLKSIRTIDREYLPEDNVLLMGVESGVANQYILDLRKAVIRGMEGKAARGWIPNRPPQGYGVNPLTKEIDPIEPQFQLLRQAWDLLLTGAYTVPQIRSKLQSWGYTYGKLGAPAKPLFAESHLYRIFDNRFYCGSFTFRGQTYQGRHRVMVSPEEFDRAQGILHKDNRIQPQRHEFPFTGLIRCGRCGCLVTAERKIKHYKTTARTAAYEYYHCTHRKGDCKEVSVTGPYIDSTIACELESVLIDPEFGQWLLKALERFWDEQPPVDPKLIKQHQEHVRATEQKLERLIQLRLAGELDAQEFSRIKTQTQGELADGRRQLESLSKRASTGRQALINAVRFGLDAPRHFAENDTHLKRYVATMFGIRYVLTLGKLEITPHPLLTQLAALEPPKSPRNMVGAGALRPDAPIEWSWRELNPRPKTNEPNHLQA